MTLDEAILHAEEVAADCEAYENQDATETRSYPSRRKCAAEHRQLAAWLRELQERRKAPEIVTCRECKHYKPMSSDWGNCYVHGSPTELHRTCHSCDYCSWAERRTDAND